MDLAHFANSNDLSRHGAIFLSLNVGAAVLQKMRYHGVLDEGMIPFETPAEMEAMLAARHLARNNKTFEQALGDVRLLMKVIPEGASRVIWSMENPNGILSRAAGRDPRAAAALAKTKTKPEEKQAGPGFW